ncbi:hypothetical protein FSP39_002087 [Pinctada imbricata]|uniref:non-chaperonin molecular chaperone ATPase n=1 Tax=Pinctada imbricata TaxID=66713 RepID=A0AA89BWQ3_PINIB|nr:hypothetical protein FSP39_002087 [Pinctada imbricata]
MPSKSKSGKIEWQECVKCHIFVHSKDLETHKSECDVKLYSHSFIHSSYGVFNAKIHQVTNELNVPRNTTDDLIFLHPTVMSLTGIPIATECIIQQNYVRIAWPMSSLPATSIGVQENLRQLLERDVEKQTGNFVSVSPLTDVPFEVDQVHLQPCASEEREFYVDDSFTDYITQKFCGKCLRLGNLISFTYFGQMCNFEVKKVVGTKHMRTFYLQVEDISLDTSDITKDLSDLNLSAINESSSVKSVVFDEESPMRTKKDNSQKSSPDKKAQDSSFSHLSHTSTPKLKGNNSSSASINDSMFKTPVIRKVKTVSKSSNSNFFRVSSQTKFVIPSETNTEEDKMVKRKRVTFASIGGLIKQIESIKEMVEMPIEKPEIFKSYGLPLPHGILLYGPGGTGKTMLMEALCQETSLYTVRVNSADIVSKFYGESEARLRQIFKDAEERAPSLIIMDDVDSLFSRRDNTQNESLKRLVATLLTLMDGIAKKSDNNRLILVIAATVNPDALDPALRRPGRFDREIEVPVPSSKDRFEILQRQLESIPHSLTPGDITEISDHAHGYVGADLAFLCQQASLIALKRGRQCQGQGNQEASFTVAKEDMSVAMTTVQPSAMREVQLEIPKVKWSDIGGQEEIKLKLRQAVEWPLKHPQSFARMGIRPPRGILMYGPPGCSKTMIAKALATESKLNFLAVKGPELFSKWVGESERAVREVFRKARAASPAIIFFDEIDALAVERGSSSGSSNVGDRVLAQLLTEMDGVVGLQDVTIVAATNRPDMIDKALMRPGRLDRILYVPLPDRITRRQIFQISLQRVPVGEDVDIEELVDRTVKYSGAEVSAVCHEAALFALQEDIHSKVVKREHFDHALKSVTPRISDSLIQFYEDYQNKSGLHSV